ncbi:MAG TPA: flagellar hook protein FlgE [Acetobacteraceae bacterium]|nr:flagellar hook protein FlgE [Acetobacteraceae bacterium]
MSLFGAMNTAISGLNAQSNAFGNISDNVANAQTVGYKRVDTSFIDFLTTSTASVNDPGSVVAKPQYVNNVQGTVTQSDNPLSLAIAGQGFFAVSHKIGETNNVPTFSTQKYYTRAGDFQMDKNVFLVNSADEALNGWPVDTVTGAVNQNTMQPIQVTQTVYNPVATTQVTLSANLPATPSVDTTQTPITSDIDVYDALGTVHKVTLSWTQLANGSWTVNVSVPNANSAQPATDCGTAQITFGDPTATPPVPEGTVDDVEQAPAPAAQLVNVSGPYQQNQPAYLQFSADFGSGAQTIQLNLGNYGGSDGVTQYAGTDYTLRGLTQNGVPPGSFASVTMQANGNIVVNYDNGQSRVIYKVPLITFNDPDQLQRQDGQSFTATLDSGTPLAEAASTNGAGNLVVESVEGSNVDIATEFSKLIVAQRAYTANTKMVTTADDMLQQTIDMKR